MLKILLIAGSLMIAPSASGQARTGVSQVHSHQLAPSRAVSQGTQLTPGRTPSHAPSRASSQAQVRAKMATSQTIQAAPSTSSRPKHRFANYGLYRNKDIHHRALKLGQQNRISRVFQE